MNSSLCTLCCKSLSSVRTLNPSSTHWWYNNVTRCSKALLHCTRPSADYLNPDVSKFYVLPDVTASHAPSFSGKVNEQFEREDVQTILKRLNKIHLDKVFQVRAKEHMTKPKYKLATPAELDEADEKIKHVALRGLNPPPVRELRKSCSLVLSEDPMIIDFDDDKADIVFTDISDSVNDDNRAILKRENATGILQEVDWDVRDRINFTYWPKPGQLYTKPPMLEDEKNLHFMFDELRHKEVLDFIYVQYKEDSPHLQEPLHLVYEDLAERDTFEVLESTRYYSGMVFYFVSNNRASVLLDYFRTRDRKEAMADVVRLHSLLHADFKYDTNVTDGNLVKSFEKFYYGEEEAGRKITEDIFMERTTLTVEQVFIADNESKKNYQKACRKDDQ